MAKKILILKNDRTGDLFTSLKTINKIIGKYDDQNITIYLSHINQKFSFIFPNINKKIISMNLTIMEKIKIFIYLLFNDIDSIYILTPKNFYYYLPFIFRKIKFYGITIKAKKSRPNKFLLKYLYKYVVLDRVNIKKRNSTYNIQQQLVNFETKKNHLVTSAKITHNFNFPKNFVFFHYKHNFFNKLLKWEFDQIFDLISFLSKNFENVLFSSEIFNEEINDLFASKYNTYDFDDSNEYFINENNIYFLKNIDGYDLFNTINHSSKIISPEGIITHIGYFLNKSMLSLLHFNLKNREDFISQVISCKEWFPPNNYEYLVLKKDFDKSINKIKRRIY